MQLVIVIYLRVEGLQLHSVLIKTSQLALRMAGGWQGDVVSNGRGRQESGIMGPSSCPPCSGTRWTCCVTAGLPMPGRTVEGAGVSRAREHPQKERRHPRLSLSTMPGLLEETSLRSQ